MAEKGAPVDKRWWQEKGWAGMLLTIALFVIIAVGYFTPAAFEGRVLFQADGAAAAGTGQDVVRHQVETGDRSLWTGSLFGGMPMYQISPSYPSADGIKLLQNIYRLRGPINLLPGDSYLIFMMLLGFYLFMRSWGVRRLLSIGGAVMWAFSSYFLILIEAGHLWKLLALSYIPPTMAGLVWAFHRKRYGLGVLITGIFSALQIYSNHIQMSYYFAFLMFAMVVAWGIESGKRGDWKHLGKALLSVGLGGLLGIAINGTSLYHTYEYSKETMRGGREITVLNEEKDVNTNEKGLNKSYITQWSYGISEMLTFLIPDAKGGASGQIGLNTPALKEVAPKSVPFIAQQNRYWGDQPFTAGPVYVGAFVLLLAIFGAIVAKGPMKWALLLTTLLTIMLSWGHNFMWLTSFFIDHFPLYDKFRTPSSILVVAEMTIPLFAIWALKLILQDPEIVKREKVALIVALTSTVGIALLIWLLPTAGGRLLSTYETDAFGRHLTQMPHLAPLISDLEQTRATILSDDAFRSLIILLSGITLIWLFITHRLKATWMVTLVILLTLIDLWSVDKRYLNDSKYLPKEQVTARVQHQTVADKAILKDTTQYRVLNLTVNTFSDATTSYNHRSIGGYHAAKLQRYQDLIDGYLNKQDLNILRALNTKYYIVPDSLLGQRIMIDDATYGDAWFVNEIRHTATPDEEFINIGQVNLSSTAIIAPPYSDKVGEGVLPKDSLATIQLIDYTPDQITYRSQNSHPGVAIFSEIFYPHGWKATIDGVPTEILRVNYILRGIKIPAGEHEIVMTFAPLTISIFETIAYIANGILLLLLIFMLIRYIRLRQTKHATDTP